MDSANGNALIRDVPVRLGMLEIVSVLARRRTLRRRESWNKERLVRHQERKLLEIRDFAMRRSPYYRKLHAGLERAPLEELPVLTKRDLMEHWEEICTDQTIRLEAVRSFLDPSRVGPPSRFAGSYFAAATSGTSGRPGIFIYSEDEWKWVLASYSRANDWAGVAAGLFHPLKLAVVSTTKPWHQSAIVGASLQSRLVPTLRLDASSPIAAIVDELNENQPRSLVAYATMARALAREQLAHRLHIAPQAVFCASEVLSDIARTEIEQAFGSAPFETYAATETAGIASDCEYRHMHMYEDLLIPEVVDAAGKPTPAGTTGDRLLTTVLFSRTLPLIRYELDDRVTMSKESCPCGLPFAVLASVEGRTEDSLLVRAVGGAAPVQIHPNLFHDVLDSASVAGWQVVQTDLGHVVVRVVSPAVETDIPQVRSRLENGLRAHGSDAEIDVHAVDRLDGNAAGKVSLIKRFVSKGGAL